MDRLEFVITGNPITKKNSQRIISVGGRWRIIPSKQFVEYERNALYQLFRARRPKRPIDVPVKRSHTLWGAGREVGYSYRHTQRIHERFAYLVAENLGLKEKMASKSQKPVSK